MNGSLMSAYKGSGYHQGIIQDALRYKAIDPGALYRPLLVQAHGVFENYIRSVVKAVIEDKFEPVPVYKDHPESFRKDHITHAARILMHWKENSIMGIPYTFEVLLNNLGVVLSGGEGYKLNPEIFTKLMGNPTPTRLEKLFHSLSLPAPFSDDLGRNTALRNHFGDQTKGRVAVRTKEKLEKQIDLRNDIVHGDLTRAVDHGELQDTVGFFRALISGIDELLKA